VEGVLGRSALAPGGALVDLDVEALAQALGDLGQAEPPGLDGEGQGPAVPVLLDREGAPDVAALAVGPDGAVGGVDDTGGAREVVEGDADVSGGGADVLGRGA